MNQLIVLKQVSTFEAKTHLSKMIVKVEHGESFTITKRGKPVAQIIPYKAESKEVNYSELVDSIKKIRTKIKGSINLKQMKESGRKR